MARFGIKHELSVAIRAATGKRTEQTVKGLHLSEPGLETQFDIVVRPIVEPIELRGLLLVVFREGAAPEKELLHTKEYLQTTIEELQSLNEESATVNAELQNRIDEQAKTSDDLKNLLDTSQVATIFLDTELRIRRFTAKATEFVKLVPGDIGRPIDHFALNLKEVDLAGEAEQVLDTLDKREFQARTNDGRVYSTRIIPYRMMNNVIDGVVVNF